jgi:hypothetical protein
MISFRMPTGAYNEGLLLTSTVSDNDGDDDVRIRAASSSIFVIGGSADDQISSLDSTFNVIIGDYGIVNIVTESAYSYDLSILASAKTLHDDISIGNDRLTVATSMDSFSYYNSRSLLFGGSSNDIIQSSGQCALLCGDDCSFSNMASNVSLATLASLASFGGYDRLSFLGNRHTQVCTTHRICYTPY